MDKHFGNIVEYNVRKKGFNISELAKALQANRRSVYNWFNQRHLKQEIIVRIGCAIEHDFSVELPELFTRFDFPKIKSPIIAPELPDDNDPNLYQDKYIVLLETYNNLLCRHLN